MPEKSGMTKAGVVLALAIILAGPTTQSAPSLVNVAYGNSWPRSVVVDSARQLVFVDGESGIYPPDGFSFGVMSTANDSVGRVVGLPEIPGQLALDASSGTVFAAGQNSVVVFDGPTMTLERTIALKIAIFSMAFDGSTGDLLLTSGNSLFQLDPSTGQLLRNATVGKAAEGIAVDEESGTIFVADYLSSSISVLRSSDLALIATIKLPSPAYPSQLALDSKRGIIFATTDGQSVIKVSSTRYTVLGSIQVSHSSVNGTYALAVDPPRDRLFVAAEPGTTISELNETTGALLASFNVESDAFEMAVDGSTGTLYVTDYHLITVYTPGSVVQQPGLYEILVVSAAGVVAVAACVLAWRFIASGGRRDGSVRPRQRGQSLPRSSRLLPPAAPSL